jgi:putative DNA primase/helicase
MSSQRPIERVLGALNVAKGPDHKRHLREFSPPKQLFGALEPENIPRELKGYAHWVVWKAVRRGAKIDKHPYDPKRADKRASTTDSRTWATFPEALEALEFGGYDGVGFVFSSGDPYVGIDLDDCRDPETSEIEEWARAIIAGFTDKYVETSPSGEGVHVITKGVLKKGTKRTLGVGGAEKKVEVYGQDRFFTMTGMIL